MWLLVKLVAVVALYGAAIEPRIVVRENESAAIPGLPAAWEGKQVAAFADLQVGMWWSNRDAARRLVRQVVKINPAFVLVAGDFVYDADERVDAQMTEVLSIMQPLLDHRIPTYAVLGNHDYSLMNEGSSKLSYVAEHVRRALDGAGVHMMDNRAVPLWAPGADSATSAPLYLIGIGERWADNDRDTVALSTVPPGAPRLVFMHDPDSFAAIPAGDAPVAIAAHTHGMQLGIPYVTDYIWRHHFSSTGSGAAGWIDDYGEQGNHIYVNRGVGFSILPIRVNAFPELTVFTLTKSPVRQP